MAKDSQLVLAFFEDEASADRAAAELQQWTRTNPYVQLGAVGVLVKDELGDVKMHKLGPRETRKGIGIGVALGIVAAVASGGVTLFEGVAVGGIGGGGLGFLFRKGLGMTSADAARISDRLDSGHAAVGVLAPSGQAAGIATKLAELGGEPETHDVAEEHLQKVAAGAEPA
jgi:hypothetical protein